MSQTETINTPQDYVNYTFNVEARGITELSSDLVGLSNTASNILGLLAFKTSEFLSHTQTIAMGAGIAISAVFTSAMQDAIRFEQQIANVQAIGGEAVNAKSIGDAAMEYSNKFGMATSSMTEGLEALARAGITATDTMKGVLEEGVKLSKLEGMDLEDSINDLISTTNLLSTDNVNMNDSQYAEMVKQMNQHIVSTSESAPINAQNIIQSLQHVGGYASAGGMDQDDLFAVIAQLGSRGTKGEMAGTALRAFIAAGQKDTAQRALSRIGLNVSDLWNEDGETMLSISEMKDVLDKALENRGYSKQEKLEFYSDFAGYKQANQIMKIDTTEVKQYKENIANAWDLGKKLDVILGTVRGNLDRIWQTAQNFMTKVGSNILGVMSAILTPVRMLLDIFTKIPFADKAVAAGLIFVAFRTGLTIFNKLTPALTGFISGIDESKNKTKGIRHEWQKTREEIEKTKDIISMIKKHDREGLIKKHYEEHGLSAKNKASAEQDVAAQMYVGSSLYKQTGRTPFHQLPNYVQDMFLERIKATNNFGENYKNLVNRTKDMIDKAVEEPILITEYEGQDTLEAINTWVQLIFDLLNSDRTRGQTDNTSIGQSELEDNRKRNAQIKMLSDAFNNRVDGKSYGNVDFKYEQSEEGYIEARKGLQNAYKDLRKYTEALSNTDLNNVNSIQKNVYRKLFTTTVSERGKEATRTANESEIRLIFEKGKLESHEKPYEGIKDSQVDYIAKKLGLHEFENHDYQKNDRRAEFAQAVHKTIQSKPKGVRKQLIDEIIYGIDGDKNSKGTNSLWNDSLNKMAIGRQNFLEQNSQIVKTIISQIPDIKAQGQKNDVENILSYFNNLDRNHENWNIAIRAAMENLKGESSYSEIEKNTIKYIADNIERHKNTILNYQNNAESLGFSDAIQDEIKDIISTTQKDTQTLKNGGEQLGAAIVEGFVVEGLGRHSPGRMFWALVDEQTDINHAILQSKGIVKNVGLLGLEMTNVFDKNLGMSRVFDSGIEFLRRDSNVIKDIIDGFDRDEYRTDAEQDLEYDLLPLQQDVQDHLTSANKKSLEQFVRPYGFDVSNYERFGSNFGINRAAIPRFESMMWFLANDFDFSNLSDSNLFSQDNIDDYQNFVEEAFDLNIRWLDFKSHYNAASVDYDISSELFDELNSCVEDFYFIFLSTVSQNMRDIILRSSGLADNTKLYRGGRLDITSDFIGEYLGFTSTSYTPRIADLYTASNGAVNYKTNVFAPEGTLGIYPNADLLGNTIFSDGVTSKDVYDNQIEYTLGSGQPYIELPNEATGRMSAQAVKSEADVLLLTPTQIADVTNIVVDEVSSMLNSGRTDSHILNQAGIDVVNDLVSFKAKENTKEVNENVEKKSPKQKGPGYTSFIHEPIDVKFNDMVNFVSNFFKEEAAMGRTFVPRGPFDYNPESFNYDNSEQISTFIHEMTHLLRNQYDRRRLSSDDSHYIPSTFSDEPVGNYQISHFQEWEAEYVEYRTLQKLGMVPSKIAEKRMKEHEQFLKDKGHSQYMHYDELDSMADFFADNIEKVIEYIDKSIYDISKYSMRNYQFEYANNIATWKRTKDLIRNPQSKRTKILPSFGGRSDDDLVRREGYEIIGDNDENITNFRKFFMPLRADYQIAHPRAKGDSKKILKAYKKKEKDLLQDYGIFITRGERLLNIKNKEAAQVAYLDEDVTFKKLLDIQKKYDTGYDETDLLKWGYYKNDKSAKSYYNKINKNKQAQIKSGVLSQQEYDKWKNSIQNYIPSKAANWHNYFDYDDLFGDGITETGSLDDEFTHYIHSYLPNLILKKNKNKNFITADDIIKTLNEKTDFIGKEISVISDDIQIIYDSMGLVTYNGFKNPLYQPLSMPGLSTGLEYINYTNQEIERQRQIEEEKRKNLQDIEIGKYRHIMSVGVQTPSREYTKREYSEKEDERYEKRINEEMKTKYASIFPDMENRFNKARYNVNKDGKGNQKIMSGLDWAEDTYNRIHDKTLSVASKISESYDEKSAQAYADSISTVKKGIDNILTPMRSFNEGLDNLSAIFPPLSVASWGLNMAIQGLEGVSWVLSTAQMFLTATELADTLVTWGLVTAEEASTISKAIAAGATWILNGAIAAFEFLISGPVLVAIAAIIAAIGTLVIWENHHAKSLKESQEALEKSTAKNNIAFSQYKDLNKARQNETDAIKRQQLARKESIALYELEASRLERLKNIKEESELRNDKVWGEYGLRANFQKMGWLESIFAGGIPFLGTIAKWQAGDFESQYENYEGTTANIRKIKEDTVGNFTATPEQRYVASVYDSNSMFFAQVEAYQKPLQELYDKESKLIDKYGSDDLARGSQEFREAVQEFADATGLNGETAGKMLDWLETENRVQQGMTAAKAVMAQKNAKYDAARAKIQYGNDASGLGNLDNLQDQMLLSEIQAALNEDKQALWWDTLFKQLEVIWLVLTQQWDKVSMTNQLIEQNKLQLNEMNSSEYVKDIYDVAKNAADNAERKDYGTGKYTLMDSDTPFGGAIDSAAAMYTDEQQENNLKNGKRAYTDNEYLGMQNMYKNYFVNNQQAKNNSSNQEAFITDTQQVDKLNKNKNRYNKKFDNTLSQLQYNGSTAHSDAISIINAIEKSDIHHNKINPDNDSNNDDGDIISMLFGAYKGLSNINTETSNEIQPYTGGNTNESPKSAQSAWKNIDEVFPNATSTFKSAWKNIKTGYAEGGLKGAFNSTKNVLGAFKNSAKSGISEALPNATSILKTSWKNLKTGYNKGGIEGLFDAVKFNYHRFDDAIESMRQYHGYESKWDMFKDAVKFKTEKTFPNAFNSIEDILKGGPKEFLSSSKNILKGNIKSKISSIFPEGTELFKTIGEHLKSGYSEGGIKGLFSSGKDIFNAFKNTITEETDIFSKFSGIFDGGAEGIVNSGKNIFNKIKGGTGIGESGIFSKLSEILYGKQVPGITAKGGINLMREGGVINNLKAGLSKLASGYSKGGIEGLFDSGKSIFNVFKDSAKSGMGETGIFSKFSGIFDGGAEGIVNSGKNIFSGISKTSIGSMGKTVVGGVVDSLRPSTISKGISEIGVGLKGGGTLLSGVGKTLPVVGSIIQGATTFAEEYETHDPTKKHYNEDGTEKKAGQSTGEVVGGTAGSVGGMLAGAEAGALIGGEIGATVGSVVPGVGTAAVGAVGAVGGGIIGAIVGEKAMKEFGEWAGGEIGKTADYLYNDVPGVKPVVDAVGAGAKWVSDTVFNDIPVISDATSSVRDFANSLVGKDTTQKVNEKNNNAIKNQKDKETQKQTTNKDAIKNERLNRVTHKEGAKPFGFDIGSSIGSIFGDKRTNGNDGGVFGNFQKSFSKKSVFNGFKDSTDKKQQSQSTNVSKSPIHIHNLSINTEDDPEKIKTAFMNLLIEMGDQVNPRQVSRTIGTPPTSTTQDSTTNNQTENTDSMYSTDNNNNNNNNTNPNM